MIAPKSIASKISNGLRYVQARPSTFIPPNVRAALEKASQEVDVTPEDAAFVVKWYSGGPYGIPKDVFKQLVGKDAGLSWFKNLAKKAAPIYKEDRIVEPPTKVKERRIVHESVGIPGRNGWTPTFTSYEDSGSTYIFVDWTGGSGAKPGTGYIGSTGLTNDLMEATSFSSGGGTSTVRSIRYVDADTAVTISDDIIIATAGCTITLPPVAGIDKYFTIKSKTIEPVVVSADGTELIDGEDSQILNIIYYSIDLHPEDTGDAQAGWAVI